MSANFAILNRHSHISGPIITVEKKNMMFKLFSTSFFVLRLKSIQLTSPILYGIVISHWFTEELKLDRNQHMQFRIWMHKNINGSKQLSENWMSSIDLEDNSNYVDITTLSHKSLHSINFVWHTRETASIDMCILSAFSLLWIDSNGFVLQTYDWNLSNSNFTTVFILNLSHF